jgi:hypothetical protein
MTNQMIDLLTRINKALPILSTVLNTTGLAGGDIADGLIAEVNAMLANPPKSVDAALLIEQVQGLRSLYDQPVGWDTGWRMACDRVESFVKENATVA